MLVEVEETEPKRVRESDIEAVEPPPPLINEAAMATASEAFNSAIRRAMATAAAFADAACVVANAAEAAATAVNATKANSLSAMYACEAATSATTVAINTLAAAFSTASSANAAMAAANLARTLITSPVLAVMREHMKDMDIAIGDVVNSKQDEAIPENTPELLQATLPASKVDSGAQTTGR
jgi:hypothetical protein